VQSSRVDVIIIKNIHVVASAIDLVVVVVANADVAVDNVVSVAANIVVPSLLSSLLQSMFFFVVIAFTASAIAVAVVSLRSSAKNSITFHALCTGSPDIRLLFDFVFFGCGMATNGAAAVTVVIVSVDVVVVVVAVFAIAVATLSSQTQSLSQSYRGVVLVVVC